MKNLTEVVCVIDRSGSMEKMGDEAVQTFNGFLKKQKQDYEDVILSLTLFSTEGQVIHQGVPIADVPELTMTSYAPDGGTALFDAVCTTIDEVDERIQKMKKADRPSKVLYVIMTDGEENSSQTFKAKDFKARMGAQKKKGREFVFLAAGPDTFKQEMGSIVKSAGGVLVASTGAKGSYAVAMNALSGGLTAYKKSKGRAAGQAILCSAFMKDKTGTLEVK